VGTPFIGEIRTVGFNFAPPGWLVCAGQLVSIAEYDTLFNLIGTTYGGDGQETFALPDLRGRVPVHTGAWVGGLGESGGQESVTLVAGNAPAHVHTYQAVSTSADNRGPQNQSLAKLPAGSAYRDPGRATNMVPPKSNPGGQPHENLMPYLAITFMIATQGIYPSPS
jgi:microcystin-dependent protein